MDIKYATYVSVWDGGFEVRSKCKVDTVNKRVFDVETVDVGDSVDTLDNEYVVVDGEEHAIYEDGELYYE